MSPRRQDDARLGYNPSLFEHSGRWDLSLDPKQEERVDRATSLIPQGTRSVLDVGCGDGSITRRIAGERWVVGCDTSVRGLQRLRLNGVCGSLTQLPFRSRSFDLISAFEVLEHLPPALGGRAREEMARVARRHVLLSVPNSENLDARMARCPDCRRPFHVYNHLTTFFPDRMHDLIPGFRLTKLDVTPHTRPGAEVLSPWLRAVGLPLYEWAANIVCPHCHRTDFPPGHLQVLALRLVGLLARLTPGWRVPAGWILALYGNEA